jgi:hypothetical protein
MADSLKTRKLILDNNSNINLSDEEFKKMIVTYIKVKNTKSTITYKKETLNIIIQDALKFNKSYGLGKCIQYVDKKFNGFENQEGSEFYNVTKKNNEDSNSISVKTIVDNKFIQNKMKFK